MTPLLMTTSLTKSFGQVAAVRDVSLQVNAGEIVGLLGANGAGKTTFMRCGLGILEVSGGRSLLFGDPPSRAGRARIGYVPQNRGLYADLTPRENAGFVAAIFGQSGGAPSLSGYRDVPVRDLPLGQQRRLAFDLALAHRPGLLVLDEPTSGVGPLESARLWEIIGAQAEAGTGVLVTTHNMTEASQCDRLAIMIDGRLAAEGTEAEIIGGTRAVTVDAADWQAAFDALLDAGLLVSLAGTSVRVLGTPPERVEQLLVRLPATINTDRASLDECMALLGL
ncbi:ABC transporter ATP-binding protein [Brooklawnia sp.]|uniref:ABC transporter ATP-binding protein n=1 Tax=Brooklawnia sp. TaxID=2699740 RepID=UPI00311E008A